MTRKRSLLITSMLIAVVIMGGGGRSADARSEGGMPPLSFAKVAGGLQSPTHITHAGDGSGRLFVTEQQGRIRIVKDGRLLKKPFLDITKRVSCCGERGLLSVAFPPDFVQKKYFYVNYTNSKGDTVVSRFFVSSDPDAANPESESIILTIDQPYANHNGGQIAFGPDGYLYIGMGDGGAGGDPKDYAQSPGSLLGKMLRIDVESKVLPYGIPGANPFVKTRGYRDEIWALGLRNPWRFSFDRQTGDLYIADVGQDRYEEIHVQPAASRGGENYGWDIMEGAHCFEPPVNCDRSGLVMPVTEYDHSRGCSITGGMVYRGGSYPSLQGVYLYGDYCSGRVWGMRRSGSVWQSEQLADTDYAISTFGEDAEGALYLADHAAGVIYRIEARK